MKEVRISRRDFVAVVDDEDADLAELRWYAHGRRGRRNSYATRNAPEINGKAGPKIFLHRVIAERMGLDLVGREVDHINGDTMDNRRSNLRAATRAQNTRNRSHWRTRSGIKGVHWHAGKWQARITVDGKTRSLGHFHTVEEARDAYARAALELHGEFARVA